MKKLGNNYKLINITTQAYLPLWFNAEPNNLSGHSKDTPILQNLCYCIFFPIIFWNVQKKELSVFCKEKGYNKKSIKELV